MSDDLNFIKRRLSRDAAALLQGTLSGLITCRTVDGHERAQGRCNSSKWTTDATFKKTPVSAKQQVYIYLVKGM